MSLNLVYDRTEEDETSAAAIRSAYQKLGNWSGLTDAERAQLERGALTYNTLNRVEQAVKTLAAALTSAGYPVEVTPVLKGASRLPTGYTEVEWIESSGTQYIDTGVSGGNSAAYEIVMNPLTASLSYEQYFAGDKNPVTPKIFREGTGTNMQFQGTTAFNANGLDSAFHDIEYSGGTVKIDGSTAGNTGAGGGWGTLTWWVFNAHGEPTLFSTMRLKSLKMWMNEILVRDFIPCKNPSGAVGLYDLVGGQFYGNTGTGSFTAGAEVGKAEDREWQEGDVLYRPQWTTYLDNVQRLRDAYYTLAETGELPASGDKLNYTGANTIEKVLADIDLLLDGMKSSYRRCGTFRAGNNAAHLPLKGSI